MHWFVQAPSNIALIKYMGKQDESQNLPANPSLSYTLGNLKTSVKLESVPGKKDFWEPLEIPGVNSIRLSEKAQARYLKHLAMLKSHFNYEGAFIVRSSNNFPMSSGLASSASSFAALTKCAVQALSELTHIQSPDVDDQAALSRLGSGSSCRSFYAPWALWKNEEVKAIDLPYRDLIHRVIVISHEEKAVSSSEAHRRFKTSPHYEARLKRAGENLKLLIDALEQQAWETAYNICWREFQDMHHVFMSCAEPFNYMSEDTARFLNAVQDLWQRKGDGPIVTMDAGPNVHLLFRPDQLDLEKQFHQDVLINNYDVL